MNAEHILGNAARSADERELAAAHARYLELVRGPAAAWLLHPESERQPYPAALAGVPARRCASLLEACALARAAEQPAGIPTEWLSALRRRIEREERRGARLEEQAASAAAQAAALRSQAELLLARLERVPRGVREVELENFTGENVRIALDPALAPAENANRLYDEARKREKAAQRVPALVARAHQERIRLAALLARAETGAASREELAQLFPDALAPRARTHTKLPPYRRYRTSGGLEVRVGRNRRANDELTFHHAARNDIWLHARDAAGSHVVLRWQDPDAQPPARDLTEAAVLAALHSRARTSGTVAVDWTRRKYVRKPRKAQPGVVTVERVKTLFVEPDPDVEKKLRVGEP